jgi:hypothetical protein
VERDRLLQVRQNLKSELKDNCGEIPSYDPAAPGNDEERTRWYLCSDDLRHKIDLVQNELRKL